MASLVSVKLVLLGNASVGKSSILQRFSSDVYNAHKPPTVGAAFTTKVVICNKRKIKMDIWDTAGQEKYRSMTPLYYRGAYAAIIVYDITDKKSYEGAINWIKEIKQIEGDKIKIVLCGNKVDLQNSSRQIDSDIPSQYAKENGFIFIETSAKTGCGIKAVFQQIGQSIPENINNSNKSDLSSSQLEFMTDEENFTEEQNNKLCC